ncbi:PREDICTED: uncharacterized protein LOC106110945 [Papilio polytes]|uniref:uncharacterized protein LOC106110945 n=1 Tax=Papilio polytes TaxID=76194 RepID=UPI0006761B0D|nr:PREDICTED: uncharacterized protein LOC106110945 [Papilio polytes]
MRLAIAFLFVATWQWCDAYDYASACARPHRASRTRATPRAPPAPPCDLARHAYCATPGSGYPWHAIRRFVKENQGLMRRMYGEERHISVLKAELENFIEDDDEDSRKKSSDFEEDIIKAKLIYTKKSPGRAMRDKPHFRPIQTDKHKKFDNDTLKVKPLENYTNNSRTNSTNNNNTTEITSNETMIDEKEVSYKTKLQSIANIEINNLDQDVITLEAVIKQTIETNSLYPTFLGSSKSEPLRDDSDYKNNTDRNATTTTEYSINATETTYVQYDDTTTESVKDGWKPMSDASTLPPTLLFSEHEKVKNDKMDTKVTDKKEETYPKPTQPESMRPSVIKLRGANACESKEEMAAPFWANSTRGEVLALLNMYPFEQYIHLETCVHERKQMYCREGCRCEQQYRLHRLLAYDPRNECRGIFADWFKFPACCVCRCYDVPLEFRARSPRLLRPQYDEHVRQVIYEDAARDWYSMAYDEDDDFY